MTNKNDYYIVIIMKTDYEVLKKLFYDKCAEKRFKITPQRQIIFDEIANATDHPTADAIYQRVKKTLPNISFDTVYRTLLTFTETGVVNLVQGTGGQKRFEPNLHQHHHFICIKCNAIYDFENDAYNDIAVPKDVEKHGAVINKKVVLEGICSKCNGK